MPNLRLFKLMDAVRKKIDQYGLHCSICKQLRVGHYRENYGRDCIDETITIGCNCDCYCHERYIADSDIRSYDPSILPSLVDVVFGDCRSYVVSREEARVREGLGIGSYVNEVYNSFDVNFDSIPDETRLVPENPSGYLTMNGVDIGELTGEIAVEYSRPIGIVERLLPDNSVVVRVPSSLTINPRMGDSLSGRSGRNPKTGNKIVIKETIVVKEQKQESISDWFKKLEI